MHQSPQNKDQIEHQVLLYSARLLKQMMAASFCLSVLMFLTRSIAYIMFQEEISLRSIPITLFLIVFSGLIYCINIESIRIYNYVILVVRSVLSLSAYEIILSISCQRIFSIFIVSKLITVFDQYQIFNQSHQILQTFFLHLYFLIRSAYDRERTLAFADLTLLLLASGGSYLQFYYSNKLFGFLRCRIEQVQNLEQRWFNTLKNQNNGVALLTLDELKLEFINNSMKNQFGIMDRQSLTTQEQLFAVTFRQKEDQDVIEVQLKTLLEQSLTVFKDYIRTSQQAELALEDLNKQFMNLLCKTFKIKETKRVVEISTLVYKEREQFMLQLMSKDVTTARFLEKSKQLERMKTIYFCSVAHDLKTPINSIMATNQHLLNRFDGDINICKLFKINLSSCDFLLRIINDITDLSRIELKEFEIEKQWFDLEQLLQEVLDILSISLELKKLQFGFKVSNSLKNDNGLCWIYSDPKRIKQILLNLVGNSLKFTFTGGIYIEARELYSSPQQQQHQDRPQTENQTLQTRQRESVQSNGLNDDLFEMVEEDQQSETEVIILSEAENSDEEEKLEFQQNIEFKVIDTGIGIQSEHLSTLFKLFGKVKQKSDINKQGIGLGLTICKKITELLGGKIGVESEYGKGTTFTFIVNVMKQRGNGILQSQQCENQGRSSFIESSIRRYQSKMFKHGGILKQEEQ